MSITPTSTLAEFNAEIAKGTLTKADAVVLLTPRSERVDKDGDPTPSAKRAAKWIADANVNPAAIRRAEIKLQKRASKAQPEAEVTEAESTRVELTPEQKRLVGAAAKAHAEATVGYWPSNARSCTRAVNAAKRNGEIPQDKVVKPGDAKPGFRLALNAEFKRIANDPAALAEVTG
jgi:hypothetical protein